MNKALTLVRNTIIEGYMYLTMVAHNTPMLTHKSTHHMTPNSKASSKQNRSISHKCIIHLKQCRYMNLELVG